TKGQLHHLLGGALAVGAGLRAEGHAATAPDGRTDGAGPGSAGALLRPRLGAAAAGFGAGLGGLGAGSAGRQLGGDDLGHHRHVGLEAEAGVVELYGAGLLARGVEEVEVAHLAPPLIASRTRTRPPLG